MLQTHARVYWRETSRSLNKARLKYVTHDREGVSSQEACTNMPRFMFGTNISWEGWGRWSSRLLWKKRFRDWLRIILKHAFHQKCCNTWNLNAQNVFCKAYHRLARVCDLHQGIKINETWVLQLFMSATRWPEYYKTRVGWWGGRGGGARQSLLLMCYIFCARSTSVQYRTMYIVSKFKLGALIYYEQVFALHKDVVIAKWPTSLIIQVEALMKLRNGTCLRYASKRHEVVDLISAAEPSYKNEKRLTNSCCRKNGSLRSKQKLSPSEEKTNAQTTNATRCHVVDDFILSSSSSSSSEKAYGRTGGNVEALLKRHRELLIGNNCPKVAENYMLLLYCYPLSLLSLQYINFQTEIYNPFFCLKVLRPPEKLKLLKSFFCKAWMWARCATASNMSTWPYVFWRHKVHVTTGEWWATR